MFERMLFAESITAFEADVVPEVNIRTESPSPSGSVSGISPFLAKSESDFMESFALMFKALTFSLISSE